MMNKKYNMMCSKEWLGKILKVGFYNKIKNFYAWIDYVKALSELEVLILYGY